MSNLKKLQSEKKVLVELFKKITEDPNYSSLSEDLTTEIDAVVTANPIEGSKKRSRSTIDNGTENTDGAKKQKIDYAENIEKALLLLTKNAVATQSNIENLMKFHNTFLSTEIPLLGSRNNIQICSGVIEGPSIANFVLLTQKFTMEGLQKFLEVKQLPKTLRASYICGLLAFDYPILGVLIQYELTQKTGWTDFIRKMAGISLNLRQYQKHNKNKYDSLIFLTRKELNYPTEHTRIQKNWNPVAELNKAFDL